MDSISSDVILLETACIEITYPVKPPSSFVLELLICQWPILRVEA